MKKKVVVEIRGGVFCGLYASDPEIEYCLVDWDEIKEGYPSGGDWFPADLFEDIPADTREYVPGAGRQQWALLTTENRVATKQR
jgi:hypothetical protein